MEDKLTCPYCGAKNEITDFEYHEQDSEHEFECSSCDQIFMYTVSYIPVYEERPTPCLNDGNHEWEKIVGIPREYFVNKRRCRYCGEEKTIKTKEPHV